jgi:hypothetical protein
MPIRTLPWSKLGLSTGWSGTLPGLRQYFGAAWPSMIPYFFPTKHLAPSIDCPRPGGPECPRQIVEHGFDDLVAVCGNAPQECPTIPVLRQDVIIHELKIGPLLADLGRLLHIQGAAPDKILPLTWNLGFYAAAGRAARPVFLCLETEPDKLRLAIMTLLDQRGTSLVLLIPSRQDCPASLMLLLQNSGVGLAALDDLDNLGGADPALFIVRHDAGGAQKEVLEAENFFRLEQDFWRIRFRGETYSIKRSMGMNYIAHLIKRAYDDEPEIYAAELSYLVNGRPLVTSSSLDRLSTEQLEDCGLKVKGPGDGLEVMTPEGKAWIKGQIKELEQQIEEFEEVGNMDEVYRLRGEKEAIEDHIAKSSGLAGGARKVTDQEKRFRQAVSKAIGNALAHMQKNDGGKLAVYLKDHCILGNFCSFRKDPSTHWLIKINN